MSQFALKTGKPSVTLNGDIKCDCLPANPTYVWVGVLVFRGSALAHAVSRAMMCPDRTDEITTKNMKWRLCHRGQAQWLLFDLRNRV